MCAVMTGGSRRLQAGMDLDLWIAARLLTAAALGVLIGLERDLNGRPAGIRTNMVIAVGACLFAILSGEGFDDRAGTQDPTRIASIVVQGIGFLGAGAVLKNDHKVLGLTTAATIWLAAAVGLAAGAGMLATAAFVAVLSVVGLVALEPLSRRLDAVGTRRKQARGEEVVREG
jgi:putative Mg2+ transporter-C (MgtC) family protein